MTHVVGSGTEPTGGIPRGVNVVRGDVAPPLLPDPIGSPMKGNRLGSRGSSPFNNVPTGRSGKFASMKPGGLPGVKAGGLLGRPGRPGVLLLPDGRLGLAKNAEGPRNGLAKKAEGGSSGLAPGSHGVKIER